VQPVEPQTRVKSGRNAFFLPDFQFRFKSVRLQPNDPSDKKTGLKSSLRITNFLLCPYQSTTNPPSFIIVITSRFLPRCQCLQTPPRSIVASSRYICQTGNGRPKPSTSRRAGCPPTSETATRVWLIQWYAFRHVKWKGIARIILTCAKKDGDQKWSYFQMLVKLGYKEIEVSFPSASQTDFDFTQKLVQTPGVVPDDVWLQVLSPCRKELIRKTVDSLKGAKKALLHLYLATSPCFQQIVFNMDNAESKALAVECTRYARSITKDDPSQAGTEWAYEFSPETFSASNPDFVLEVCEAVKAAWEPSVENPIIFNLPGALLNNFVTALKAPLTILSHRRNVYT